jgi:hypothetical protein
MSRKTSEVTIQRAELRTVFDGYRGEMCVGCQIPARPKWQEKSTEYLACFTVGSIIVTEGCASQASFTA